MGEELRTPGALREQLLSDYHEWEADRKALNAEEEANFPNGPADKDAWADSDDQGAELLRRLASYTFGIRA